jgi:peptidoglycan/LPS O-acetylase OafA/YrhL
MSENVRPSSPTTGDSSSVSTHQPASTLASDVPPRFPGFNGLRAIAALSVVGVHATFASGWASRNHFGIYTARLEIGVMVFFLISGFLLYRPFAQAHLAGVARPATGAFWVRRLLRILPAYWAALFILTTLTNIAPMGPGGWWAYVNHYLFLQIYFPNQRLFGITQAWSLCVEMAFYLFLPLYAMAITWRRDRRTPLASLVIELGGLVSISLIGFAWRFYAIGHQAGSDANSLPLESFLPAYFDVFALGMGLAVISAWTHQHRREPLWLRTRWFPWLSWCLALACFWSVSHLGIPTTPIYDHTYRDIVRQSLYGFFGLFLLLPAVFGPQDQGLIRRFLRCWPVASIGVVSYGIYLWHQAVINEIINIGNFKLFEIPFLPFFFGTVLASTAIATASYFILEKPALKLKRSFAWWKGRNVIASLEATTNPNDPSA